MRLRPIDNHQETSRVAATRDRRHAQRLAALLLVCHAVDCAGVVVRDQERAVLHDLHVDWPPAIFVVLEEASEKRLPRLHATVLRSASRQRRRRQPSSSGSRSRGAR